MEVPRGEAVIVGLRGLPERTRFSVQVQAGGKWTKLGDSRADGRGRLDLPALEARRTGEYLVRLRSPQGDFYFVKLLVTRQE